MHANRRGRKRASTGNGKSRAKHLQDNVGLAEAFAQSFYDDILTGSAIGDALTNGRAVIKQKRSPDWANYIFYGNPDFILKNIT
jgi:hypothetical protein